MQKRQSTAFTERLIYYGSRQICKQILLHRAKRRAKRRPPGMARPKDSTKDYAILRPVKMLIVLDYVMFRDIKLPLAHWDLRWRHQPREIACDVLSWTFVQLPFFTKTLAECSTRLDYWLHFLTTENGERLAITQALTGHNPLIASAYQRAAHLSLAELELLEINDDRAAVARGVMQFETDKARKLGLKQGIEQGIEQGIAKGADEEKRRIATNLIQNTAMSDEQIAKIVKSDASKIAAWRKQL